MPGPIRISAALAATLLVATTAHGAAPSAHPPRKMVDKVAQVIAAPSDFTLFALGVAGLIIGRLGLGRRRKPRPPVTAPPAPGIDGRD